MVIGVDDALAIGSLVAGVGSAAGSMFGSNGSTSLYKSQKLMKYQAKLNRKETQWLNENQYNMMRTGLENAGYNPLLALGASPAESNVSMAQVPNEEHDYSSLLNAMATVAQIRKTDAETTKINSNIVDKISGIVDKLGKKFGFGKNSSGKLIDLFKNVIGMSQNSAKGSNNPVLTGGVEKNVDMNGKDLFEFLVNPNKHISDYRNSNTASRNSKFTHVYDLEDLGYSPIPVRSYR